MKNGKLQAKDLDDREFLELIDWASEQRVLPGDGPLPHLVVPHWVQMWNLERLLPFFPPQVILAKARALLRRGLLRGCGCGCRGDFELTAAGRSFLAAPLVAPCHDPRFARIVRRRQRRQNALAFSPTAVDAERDVRWVDAPPTTPAEIAREVARLTNEFFAKREAEPFRLPPLVGHMPPPNEAVLRDAVADAFGAPRESTSVKVAPRPDGKALVVDVYVTNASPDVERRMLEMGGRRVEPEPVFSQELSFGFTFGGGAKK